MPDPNLFRLRMTFCKQGRLAMLSHLEVARALDDEEVPWEHEARCH